MVSNAKAEKLNNKLRGASAPIQGFRGSTIKHLKHHIHLNYVGTEVLFENIAFCLNNFLRNKASKNTEPFDLQFFNKTYR